MRIRYYKLKNPRAEERNQQYRENPWYIGYNQSEKDRSN